MILCTPIAPARTGNGLAMRAGVLLESLAGAAPVDLVVLPVSGPAAPLDWARALARSASVVSPVPAGEARRHLDRQLGDPWLRTMLTRAAPLPAAARSVPPTLVDAVADPADPVDAVVGLRLALAPFAVALARRIGAARVVVDADDDDARLLRELGQDTEADATERLARTWLPECDDVWAASAVEAAAIGARYGVAVRTVPNAIRTPADVASGPPTGADLLYVGNLTYAPNLDAARVLASEILPRVRAVRPDATLTVVGPIPPGAAEDLARDPHVTCTGSVPAVGPFYEAAAVVVVPLRHGAGTRIKVLEAAAFGRPIVASSTAVAGLELDHGRTLVVADGPAATARAVLDVLADPDRAAARAAAARAQVGRYSTAVVGPEVRSALAARAAPEPLTARVLWNAVEIHAATEVRDALATVLPTAEHAFPAGETLRYAVERDGGGFSVFEGVDLVGRVPTAAAARDVVHARFHRRVFERASVAGWLRVHGALVDIGGVRVLCTGAERAGKSTLALRMLLDGWAVQGDESVVLRGRDAVAVARPVHCKPGTEAAVPELGALDVPVVDGIRIVDPGRIGRPVRIGLAPIDHVVVLTGAAPVTAGTAVLAPAAQTEVLPDLVDALFPVTESKPALLRALARALVGVGCHRLARAEPAAMVRALGHLG